MLGLLKPLRALSLDDATLHAAVAAAVAFCEAEGPTSVAELVEYDYVDPLVKKLEQTLGPAFKSIHGKKLAKQIKDAAGTGQAPVTSAAAQLADTSLGQSPHPAPLAGSLASSLGTEFGNEEWYVRLKLWDASKHPKRDEDGKMSDTNVKEMVSAAAARLAQGLETAMGWSMEDIARMRTEPMQAILNEWKQSFDEGAATELDLECVDYVDKQKAGSNQRVWPHNGLKMDHEESGTKTIFGQLGLTLNDIMKLENISKYNLDRFHVFVLRLYTTAAYWAINSKMRCRIGISAEETRRLARTAGREGKYPFPMTLMAIKEAIMKLREAAIDKGEDKETDLFRGMKDMAVPAAFMESGGCEFAPCSTTTDISVALKYSKSASPTILKLLSRSFADRGADISFLSAFPSEKEILFPPLTLFKPTRDAERKPRTTAVGNCTFLEIAATLS